MMDPKTFFSKKAEKYAKYRWDYAPQAIEAIFETAGLSEDSVVADIGAGTGMLTRHFAGRVARVYAIEPNQDMRVVAERELASHPSVQVIDGAAEATTLPGHIFDLITVAQAIHWFDTGPAIAEMIRILKPGGWLAILRNITSDDEREVALSKIVAEELGAGYSAVYPASRKKPVESYFGSGAYQMLTFDFQLRQDWPAFIGVMSTVSYMPPTTDPRFSRIESKVKEYFDHHSQDGYLAVHGETEVLIGQPAW